MADFSVGDAAGKGFGIVGRHPLAVLIWGLFIWVAIIGPVMLMLTTIAANIGPVIAAAPHPVAGGGKAAADPEQTRAFMQAYMGMMSRVMVIQPLLLVGSLAVRAILTSAVFRAVLEPEDSQFAYLRVGMRELWVLLVSFVMSIIIGFSAFAMMIPLGIITAISAISRSGVLVGVVACIVIVAYLILLIWLSLKLFMGVVMSYDHNEFRLFESWAFTRGHVWKMASLVFVQALIGIGLELVVLVIVGGVGFAFASSLGWSQPQWQAFFEHPPAQLPGAFLVAAGVLSLVIALIAGAAQAVFLAPWAEVYRQLRDSGATGTPAYAPSLGEARPVT